MPPPKVALITASSAGLGASIAHSLAPHFRVVINYHTRASHATSVLNSITSIPAFYTLSETDEPRFHAIQADVSQRTEIQRLVKETVAKMGRLDVVVSNAGWTRLTNFFDLEQQLDEGDWDRCWNVNVKSHLWLLRESLEFLERSGEDDGEDGKGGKGGMGGAFVTVASMAGVRPGGSSLPYAVTKAAEIHLTKGLALICGRRVRCNSVSPGLMMTEW